MANQMMIDIETFDTRPTGVIFQVGLVIFEDPFDNPGWKILEEAIYHLDVVEQIIAGRTMDQDTQLFWAKQSFDSWHRFPTITSSWAVMIAKVDSHVKHHNVKEVWSNSPSFDAVMMRSAHEDMETMYGRMRDAAIEFPFDFRKDMDLRTLKQLMKRYSLLEDYTEPKKTTHNSLQDCRDQVRLLGFMASKMREMHETGELTPNPDVAGIRPRPPIVNIDSSLYD